MTSLVVGLFVGGRGRRMGGVPKGRLVAPDGRTLIARLIAEVTLALPDARVVLVGDATAYAELGLPALADAPPGTGPIGGLAALLGRAEPNALALSCDLPYLGAELIRRLAHEAPEALALAPRADGRWSPLTARYGASALPAALRCIARGAHALQRVFEELGDGARELTLSDAERLELRDWDRPEDIGR